MKVQRRKGRKYEMKVIRRKEARKKKEKAKIKMR